MEKKHENGSKQCATQGFHGYVAVAFGFYKDIRGCLGCDNLSV